MANQLYPSARESFLSQNPSIDMDTDDIKVMLVKTAETFNSAHQFHADLTGANIVATSSALSGKSVTDGVFDATDITFTTPASGSTCNLIIFMDTGNSATSPLIAFIDTGTNLPVTTNDLDITVQWDSGTNKIFKV